MNYEKIKNDLISEIRLTQSQAEVFLLVTLGGKIMVRLIDGMLYVRGSGGFSKEVQIEGSNQMQISDFKYRNGVLTLRIS